MKNRTFQVKERELIDYIESLGFEVEARRALLEAMLRQDADITGESFRRYHDEYREYFVKFEAAKKEFERRFVLPQAKDGLQNWTLDYQTGEVTLTGGAGV